MSKLLASLRARLSPGDYLSLELAFGVLVLLAAAALFGSVAQDVVAGGPLTRLDLRVANWLHAHSSPALTAAMLALSRIHGTVPVLAVAGVLAVFFATQRQWLRSGMTLLVLPGGMLLNVAVKEVFARDRPSFEHPLVTLSTYSFPSGHVVAATLLYGLLCALLFAHRARWRWRMLCGLMGLLMVATVAFSRMYLGAHYLSDVIAAFAEGVIWLMLTQPGSRRWRQEAPRRR